MHAEPETTRTETPPARGGRQPWLALVAGVAASVVMLFPSWVGGSRMPLQNLWHEQTAPEDMPLALLPLSQYQAVGIFGMLLLGGVVAGLIVRVLRLPVWPAAVGVLLVHTVVAVQSFIVLGSGLGVGDGSAGSREMLYLGGMLGGVVVAIALAQLGCWMASRRAVPLPALAVALAAVPLAGWISMAITAFTAPQGYPQEVAVVLRWLPAVVVGVALAWCGVRPRRRIAVWVVGLLSLWLLPAAFAAIMYGLGMRVLQGDLGEMTQAAGQILPLALAESTAPVVVAAVIGAVGTALLWRRRSALRSPDGSDASGGPDGVDGSDVSDGRGGPDGPAVPDARDAPHAV